MPPPKKPRKAYSSLDLKAKVALIRDHESDANPSTRDLATNYGCDQATVSRTIKRKQEWLDMWEKQNKSSTRKRKVKKSKFLDLNILMKEWFDVARQKNMVVTGPMVLEQAAFYADALGLDEFRASQGWLHKWQQTYNISFTVLSGESAAVDQAVVDPFREKIPELCSGYAPRDIFNMDESGIFYKLLPTKSLVEKGKSCEGGKLAKDRLTVSFCCNMDGSEKEKLLVIGRAKKPHCFNDINPAKLPVVWLHNTKAWMTKDLFHNWLKNFNAKMRRQKRHVLLFLDNFAGHNVSELDLSNVKVQFFPPNTTSVLQPLDQGVIRSFKACYKRHFLSFILGRMDAAQNTAAILKQITVLDAIRWVSKAWNEVTAETIQNCFSKAGFSAELQNEETSDLSFSDLTEILSRLPDAQLTTEEFLAVEDELPVLEFAETDDNWQEEILESFKERQNDEDEQGTATAATADADSDPEPEIEKVSDQEAQMCLQKLRMYAIANAPSMVMGVLDIQTKFESQIVDKKLKNSRQSSLDDFFSQEY